MSITSLAAGALGCVALLAAPAPAQKLLDLLPKGTLAFAGTDDVRGLLEDWHASSVGRLQDTPEFADYRKAFGVEMQAAFEALCPGLHVDLERSAAMLDGPLGLACLDVELTASPDGDGRAAFGLVAGVKGHADEAQDLLDEVVKGLEGSGLVATRTTEGGLDVTTLRAGVETVERELRLAIHHETILVTFGLGQSGTDWLARFVEALDGKPHDALAERTDVRSSPAGVAGSDLRIWLDLARVWQVLRAWGQTQTGGTSVADVLGVFDRLGLGTLHSLGMRAHYAADGTGFVTRTEWPAGAPLRECLAAFLQPAKGAELLQLAPPGGMGGACAQVDWDGLLASVLRAVQVGGQVPAAEVAAGFAEFNEELGFDLGADLLGRLDGRLAGFISEVPAGEAFSLPGVPASDVSLNGLLALGTNDAKGLGEFIEAQLRRAGLHAARQSTELLGFQVHHLPVFPGIAIEYSVLPDCVVLSTSPTLVQDAVRRAAQPDLPNLASVPAIVKQRARLPAGAGCRFEGNTPAWMQLNSRMQARDEASQEQVLALWGDSALGHVLGAIMRASAKMPVLTPELAERYYAAGTVGVATVDENGFSFELLGP